MQMQMSVVYRCEQTTNRSTQSLSEECFLDLKVLLVPQYKNYAVLSLFRMSKIV